MAEIYLQLTYLTMVGELVAACESIYHVADSIYHNMDYAQYLGLIPLNIVTIMVL